VRLVIDGRRLTAQRTGVGRYLESLLQEWAVTGLPLPETRIVLSDPAGLDRVPKAEGLTAEVVGRGWPGLVWERWGLGRVLRPGDMLFAPANLIPSSWRGRSVLVMHDAIQEVLPQSFPWHVRWRFARRYRRAAARATWIIVPSRSTARDVERIYDVGAERIGVIHPAADPAFRPRTADDPIVLDARRRLGLGDDPFFLFVGKRSRRRNVPALLAAFELHRREHPTHRLVLVGPPDRCDPANPEDAVANLHLAGHVSEPILQGLMAGAVALLYPSEYEGFGLPVVEAMASGCPVVTLRNSALAEAGGSAAWYLDSPRPDRMAEAMRVLTVEPARRAELVVRGLDHARRFRRERFAEEVKTELVAVARSGLRSTMGSLRGGISVVSGSP
jgi:glycosyltransferase involved in cell wall biosynthesis